MVWSMVTFAFFFLPFKGFGRKRSFPGRDTILAFAWGTTDNWKEGRKKERKKEIKKERKKKQNKKHTNKQNKLGGGGCSGRDSN